MPHITLNLLSLSSKLQHLSLHKFMEDFLKDDIFTDGFQPHESQKCQMFSGQAALVTFFCQESERQAVDGVQKILFFCDFP